MHAVRHESITEQNIWSKKCQCKMGELFEFDIFHEDCGSFEVEIEGPKREEQKFSGNLTILWIKERAG